MSQINVELQGWLGNDRSIAEAAWTSSLDYQKKNLRSDDDVTRVVTMLANLKHSVPFESVVFRFWIKMPIATDRQFMTHRIQSASGMSGRYRTMPDEFLAVPQSVLEILKQGLDHNLARTHMESYNGICETANTLYRNMLQDLKNSESLGLISNDEYKRVREFMRGMLPQHNMTERVSIMNLRSFSNFMKLRLAKDAQPEIQAVARLMLDQVKYNNVCPIAIDVLENNGWNL